MDRKKNKEIKIKKKGKRKEGDFSQLFASHVFHESEMKKRLPDRVFKQVQKARETGDALEPAVAQVVADAMKDWALEHGATHFTHWFQPMTGFTAEKHDSFVVPVGDGRAITRFSYKELIKGEPDASSFPSGGLRATFEARGYTAWDMSSPAFLKEDEGGVTLCIPTAFCSYTGEALDKKTPLLRSMDAISREAVRLLHILGKKEVSKVIATVGPEQEYFLIREEHYQQRQDLVFTGRTLFGCRPPKGQEMEDHYFASIKEPIAAFMRELDEELWKVGVSARTRHNEVAPSQHELAPMFNSANIACDHNQIVMETMKKIAARHGLVCLLHEKPFAYVNGSGKHNNWSLQTDTGENLLEPGHTPEKNITFLIFLAAVIRAVDEHADLMRIAAATPGNDHRLGANEAPPAIISIYLGDQLTSIMAELAGEQGEKGLHREDLLRIGTSSLSPLPLDSSDRNRTSPFAFTGNKFEFRMVPSTASIAAANFTLNTIVADSLARLCDELEQSDDPLKESMKLAGQIYKQHSRVVFNGNNYSSEWVQEAQRRGLPNISNTVDAAEAIVSEKTVSMYEKHKVFSRTELESRYEIVLDGYINTIRIEARSMLDIATRFIVPSVIEYRAFLADTIRSLREAGADATVEVANLAELSGHLLEFDVRLKRLQESIHAAEKKEENGSRALARAFRDEVFAAMNALRETADTLESQVAREFWPLPSYGEILYHIV
ncbi:MAG: glutamine synthetase III [Leptospiraceae bacterium]|nr:glutamine synthetase III [Leptospiraceae bacterium]